MALERLERLQGPDPSSSGRVTERLLTGEMAAAGQYRAQAGIGVLRQKKSIPGQPGPQDKMSFNPSLWEAEAGGSLELQTSLVYRVRSRTTRDTQRSPVSKQENVAINRNF